MNRRYIFVFFALFLAFVTDIQAQECDIDIFPHDTIIISSSQQRILLQASDSADFYYWYENGELVEECWPTHWVTINVGEEKEITLKTGKAVGENLIPNPNFEEGYTGFSVDSLLHQADSLYYGQGQYTIGTSVQNVPHDLQPRYGFSLGLQTNGTNMLMLTNKCGSEPSHNSHWNTLYSTKIKLEDASYAFFFRIIGSAMVGTGTNGNGLAVSPYYVYFGEESINFDTYGQMNRGSYPNTELRMCYTQGGLRDFFFFPDYMVHYFLKHRSDLYSNTSADSVQISIRVREGSMSGFSKTHYILDSLDLRKICFAEKTVSIRVLDEKIQIDSIVTANVCEQDMPFVFKDSVYEDSGNYTYISSSLTADTNFHIRLRIQQDYNDTISANICEGETYNSNGFYQNSSGTYINNGVSIYGCDSVTTLSLNVATVSEIDVVDTIFEGMIYSKYGFLLSQSGTYQNYYKINSGDVCPTKINLDLFVLEKQQVNVWFPNAFQPEGNNNQDFRYYTDYDNFILVEFEVFNRWGTKVFSTKEKMNFWNGRYKDELCPNGMYIYRLLYKTLFTGSDTYIKTGEVMLIR